jgi:hypothetical protein
VFDVQIAVVQSVAELQCLPAGHFGQLPPQSTSVSFPFFAPSPQEAFWHVPVLQTPVLQSPLPLQVCGGWHFGQVGPPQSLSDSCPFLTPSVHAGAWHTPPLHTPLVQSAPALQC